MFMLGIVGCANEIGSKNKIAYITANEKSEYVNTFTDLNLGILFDFNLKLPKADKSWVNIWIEGYRDGNLVDTFPISELSYGLSPNKVEEGPMGYGIINSSNEEQAVFLYAPGVSMSPQKIENIFTDRGIKGWEYAIGDKAIGIESAEEIILAAYRQSNDTYRRYDMQDADAVKQMINEDTAVLLLKIKVEEREDAY